MQTIQSVKNVKGKKVIIRVDYNVPIVNGKVRDPFRINASLPTIELLIKKGAQVILLAHAGEDGAQTLAPIAKYLNTKIKTVFVPSSDFGAITEMVAKLENGQVMLLENIRRFDGEKTNDSKTGKAFANLADIYVNDAFSVSHRAHMSVVGIPKYISGYAGLQLQKEVQILSKALAPKHPFVFILGGAKFETKMPLIKKYMETADTLVVGGALANNFLKARGYEVGQSVVDDATPALGSVLKNPKLFIPSDVVVAREGKSVTVDADLVQSGDCIVDIGKETIGEIIPLLKAAKLVVWNGPLGWYEKKFDKGTKVLLKALDESKAQVIIGGGDTAAVAHSMKLGTHCFISTGGGATLDFLAKGTLVGITAIEKSVK